VAGVLAALLFLALSGCGGPDPVPLAQRQGLSDAEVLKLAKQRDEQVAKVSAQEAKVPVDRDFQVTILEVKNGGEDCTHLTLYQQWWVDPATKEQREYRFAECGWRGKQGDKFWYYRAE